MTASPAPTSSAVYYTGNYWNNRPEVVQYMNRLATGDPDLAWLLHLRQWRGAPFRRALSLNCGNGWVERQLIEHGVVESALGIDIAEDLLQQSRAEATALSLPLEYRRVDINTDDLCSLGEFDLVVNHAAAHHIGYIDRVFRQLCRLLPDDGVLVSYDYVGPHRNQYPTHQWEAIWRANEALPAPLRKRLRYPTVPAVVASDPTEAIHSELIVPTMRRYFDLPIERYVGGSVAYDILTFNDAFFDPQVDTHDAVMRVLAADAEYREPDPAANSLFAYLVATPRKEVLDDEPQLAAWAAEESARERAAAAADGRYYPATMLERLYERIYTLEHAAYTSGVLVEGVEIPRRGLLLRQLHPIVARVPGARRAMGLARSLRLRLRRWRRHQDRGPERG
ncbi:MAG: class I SAM-dependent methyltransferase [Acidimicrobiia bacterium]